MTIMIDIDIEAPTTCDVVKFVTNAR